MYRFKKKIDYLKILDREGPLNLYGIPDFMFKNFNIIISQI